MKIKIKMVLAGAVLAVLAFGQRSIASAQTATGFPKNEAGLTAYTKLKSISQANFDAARQFFESASATSTYIVGVKSYPADERICSNGCNSVNIHFYLGADGWLAAYLLNNETPGQIVNWRTGAGLTNTLLNVALESAAVGIGAATSTIAYYDFSSPQATKMTLVKDKLDIPNVFVRTNEFSVAIPWPLEKASYSLAFFGCSFNSNYDLDFSTLYLNDGCVAKKTGVDFLRGDYDLARFKISNNGESNIIRLERIYGSPCNTGGVSVFLYRPY
jgi:hypothetical protein